MEAAAREGNARSRESALAGRGRFRENARMTETAPRLPGDWSPGDYLKFADERTRAARDLLAAVPLADAGKVIDMGCGPGNSTELLLARFPQAQITGLDSSPAMLAEARRRLPRLRFEAAEADSWTPQADVDLVFANAIYHWVPHHLEQLPRVLAALRPGGVLAVQMPDNVAEPTHRLMRELAEEAPWAGRLTDAAREPLAPARAYYDALAPHAARVDIWRTTYHHVLADADAIAAFVGSTALRPFLAPLAEAERAAFVAEYRGRIARAYPPLCDGRVLLAYPRLFLVARA
jgi:trans-aconitate 2-methyltransferase